MQTVLIILFVLFVVGLVFFLRALFLKKNIGCGVLGFLAMIPFVFIYWFADYFFFHYQTKREFIYLFEQNTGFPFPPSGKIVERMYSGGFRDSETAGIIEMDTHDYEKILNEYRARIDNINPHAKETEKRASSHRLKKQFPAGDCAYVFWDNLLWFHKNKRIIVYEYINN